MDKREITRTSDGPKRERVYSTISLYMDPDQKKRLFFTHTYNFEQGSGEEYLIKIRPYTDKDSNDRVNRLVFVAGPEPHIPIYRTRLHVSSDELIPVLSTMTHSGAKIAYTNFNGETVAVTRVYRGTFIDAEKRNGGTRGELSKELEAFGLLLSEKKKKEKTQQSKDKLPRLGTTVRSVGPSVEKASTSRDSGEMKSKRESKNEKEKEDPRYICDALRALVAKELKKSPMSIDPLDQELTPVAVDPNEINETICSELTESTKDEIRAEKFSFSYAKSDKIEKFLILNDLAMRSFELFEGVVNIKLLTCSLTGVKFGLRSN